MTQTITFPETSHGPINLPDGANLSENLTVMNSPLLFGCRTGICGTCLVQVEEGHEQLKAPDAHEQEALDVYAPDSPKARLACQIYLNSSIALKKMEGV